MGLLLGALPLLDYQLGCKYIPEWVKLVYLFILTGFHCFLVVSEPENPGH